jgi:hypothetical protein
VGAWKLAILSAERAAKVVPKLRRSIDTLLKGRRAGEVNTHNERFRRSPSDIAEEEP